jgi:hypothetical protein
MKTGKTRPTALAAMFATVLFSVFVFGCADDFNEAKLVSYAGGDSCLARSETLAHGYEDDSGAQVEVTVDGLRVFVVHKNAMFYCCLDAIVVGFSQDGHLLMLREREEVTMPCDCVCPFEVAAAIDVPSKGTYVLEIYSGVELVWREEIVV